MAKRKAAKSKTDEPKSVKKKADSPSAVKTPKNSLVANINRRKKAGKSRQKKNSTISEDAYSEMKTGWPKKRRTKA